MRLYQTLTEIKTKVLHYRRHFKSGLSSANYAFVHRNGVATMTIYESYYRLEIREEKVKCSALIHNDGVVIIDKFESPQTLIWFRVHGPYIREDDRGPRFVLDRPDSLIMDQKSWEHIQPKHPYPFYFLRTVLTGDIFLDKPKMMLPHAYTRSAKKRALGHLYLIRFQLGLNIVRNVILRYRYIRRLQEWSLYQPRKNDCIYIRRTIKAFIDDIKVPGSRMKCGTCERELFKCDHCEYLGCLLDGDTCDCCFWGEFVQSTFFCMKCLHHVTRYS